jgi:hypothetical protein
MHRGGLPATPQKHHIAQRHPHQAAAIGESERATDAELTVGEVELSAVREPIDLGLLWS